jgi:hypothetical protein
VAARFLVRITASSRIRCLELAIARHVRPHTGATLLAAS